MTDLGAISAPVPGQGTGSKRPRWLGRELIFGLVLLGPVLAVATSVVYGLGEEGDPSSPLLRIVLLADLTYFLVLTAVIGLKIGQLVMAQRRKSAGSKLHLRLTGVFAAVALVPTVIVAVFATVTVNFGIESWFSEQVGSVVRNSLATVRGYLTLIERRPGEESITDYLAEIRRESDHLQRILEDFLDFARPETARVEAVDLESVLRSAAADPALAGMAMELEIEEGISCLLRGDSQLLERAIRNLLHNAAEAERQSGRAGPLQVHISQGNQELELAIEDRGPGLPAEVRSRLFQPFVTGRSDGIGLGLSLAHRIVTLHGGRLHLEDRPEGGTRAVLALPFGAFG